MIPIKHILYENGVKEIFKLIVPSGNYAGTYEIEKPDGWDDVDSVVNIDDELFFVKDFIIGDSEKLRFMQYNHKKAFDIIKSVYKEQGGDGLIHFKWIASKDGIEYDLLNDNFDVNLNKYSESIDKSMFKIELEIKKSEAQNKLINRDETTIDLFTEKDLDDNDITAVETFDIGYKKGSKTLENFYFATAGQERGNLTNESNKFWLFSRSEGYDLGVNGNEQSGVAAENNGLKQSYFGCFISTDITLPNVKFSFSNFEVGIYTDNVNFFSDVWFYVLITLNGNVQNIQVPGTKAVDSNWLWEGSTYKGGLINFTNLEFVLPNAVQPGSQIDIWMVSPSNTHFKMILLNESPSIAISSNLESPIVKTKAVRLIDGLNQIVKNYTSSELSVISNFIGLAGTYYNTSISTGLYLRGLPAVYLNQKLKTSFKKLMNEGAAKLLVLGYDIIGSNVVIEDIHYFFKDFKFYDLSEKIYLQEDFKIANDKDIVFNTLLFGSKKYSTNKKDDIKNFITSAEFSTPIISVKNKFDKQTDLIIDEYKIQEMIEDNSTKTNDNDDDLVLIDMVNVTDYWDLGVFENCSHSIEAGKLLLKCFSTPFGTILLEVGQLVEITEGLNVGTWTVLSIDMDKMVLNKTTGIQEGVRDTPIRYKISSLTKNRTGSDGFSNSSEIRNFDTTTNIRHNPKYQMARWFLFFGSGLREKGNSELIKVTNYKNNSSAEMQTNSIELINELSGLVNVGADETLGRLRSYDQTLFNGDEITISYSKIEFEEFFQIYDLWKFGQENDRLKSRGYLSLNTPEGIFDVFPWGDGAFSHSKKTNVLTIKGKIKGKSVDNPTLLNVEQLTKNTVQLVWDFNDEYINPISKIQYSLDGINWVTLKEVNNVKTDILESDLFEDIFTGTVVYFRVIVSTADYYNKISNTIQITWQFNDWLIREISRTENINCGNSYLTLEVKGTGDFDIEWNFASIPGGGSSKALDFDNNIEIVTFDADYGLLDHYETKNTALSVVNETKTISIQLKNSDKNGIGKILNCTYGNTPDFVSSSLEIIFTNSTTSEEKSFVLTCDTIKKYFVRPTPPVV